MYLYAITNYDELTVLVSDKKYTKEEFDIMCKEAPLGGTRKNFYSSFRIEEYLKEKYGFKEANYEQSFFAGQDIE